MSFVPKRVLGKFMHVTDQPLKRPGGKSLVYFMGAGFCPFCAAERWAIVKALERFGKWEGVVEDKSAGHDEKYLNVPTFNLARAKYQSDTVEFAGKETADRNFEPLQELDGFFGLGAELGVFHPKTGFFWRKAREKLVYETISLVT